MNSTLPLKSMTKIEDNEWKKYLKKLQELNLISLTEDKIFYNSVRDMPSEKIFTYAGKSRCLYLREVYNQSYKLLDPREEQDNIEVKYDREPVHQADTARRSKFVKSLLDKTSKEAAIMDVGCGEGHFIKNISQTFKNSIGIEESSILVSRLKSQNVNVSNSINDIRDGCISAATMFHVLEHLSDPINVLTTIRRKLKNQGILIIEIPSGRNFLLNKYCRSFIDFTLWSQHLFLHSRETLSATLKLAGYKRLKIYPTQRYGISNNLYWIIKGKPSGHKFTNCLLDKTITLDIWQKILSVADITDSYICVAQA